MQLIQLGSVKHLVQLRRPLPFNIRQEDQTLLLAKGQVVETEAQLDALLTRGMMVDLAELESPQDRIRRAARRDLPALWASSLAAASRALVELPDDGYEEVLDEATQPVVALIERDPDLAIFQVLRQHGSCHTQYGVNHSIHCAIAAFLSAQRLQDEDLDPQRAFKAALTMNVSMLELQGELANQVTPLTDAQRAAIESHPQRSVEMLRRAGIDDVIWLEGVAQHHERTDGGGYPTGCHDVKPLGLLLQRCDVYTAKLSPRRSREALTADVAARRFFAAHQGDVVAAALIKEFGMYPPGTFVRLGSGESGIVVRRGANALTPWVSVLTDTRGAALARPQLRDSAGPGYGIVGTLPAKEAPAHLSPASLFEAVCA